MNGPEGRGDVFPVWPDHVPDHELWRDIGPAVDTVSPSGERAIRNVGRPTLTPYLPDPAIATGIGVIVCPGGAFFYLAIDKEGTDVALWLRARGIAAFVLQYRVVPTPDGDTFRAIAANPTPYRPRMDRVRPMVVADALQAIRTLRSDAVSWGIETDRLGIIGFSAGTHAAVGAAIKYLDPHCRPDFAASVYGEWWERWIPADAPPLFLTAAANDPLIDVSSNTSLYEAWHVADRPVELHLYAEGGHGFGLLRQGLPSDGWIDRFHERLGARGLLPDEALP